ncbi:hypothetical protein M758_12G089100 [Ceratodon purpureus]|nr:hypothetical protein M758_12G089100 [Ceratodon purpureus]
MAASRVLRWSRTSTRLWFSARTCSSEHAVGEPSLHYYNRFNLFRNAFGIAFDIDGVLIRGNETIGRAPDALRRLYKDVERGELLVPYIFLTNGGGTTEAARAVVLTRQLKVPVNPIQVLLGHTPFKSLAKRYRSRRVLAVGKGDPAKAMTSYGFPKVVKMEDFCKEFPHIDPLESYKPWVKNETIPTDTHTPANERQIAAVFVCSDPVDWGGDLQVLCDVLRSGGLPGNVDSNIPQPPIFFAADDFEYPAKFSVPRFGMGAFRIALETLYVKLTKRPLAFTSFGKPKPIVYHLAGKSLHNIARMMHFQDKMLLPSTETSSPSTLELPEPREEDPPLKTLYMIGDNPETDIAGAIRVGRPWFSILVRSGYFRGTGNHDKYPADKVVDDVYEAVDFILKREGISTQ